MDLDKLKDAQQLMFQVRGKRGRKWSLVRQGSSMQGEQITLQFQPKNLDNFWPQILNYFFFIPGEFWPMPGRFLAGGANRSIPTIEEGEG